MQFPPFAHDDKKQTLHHRHCHPDIHAVIVPICLHRIFFNQFIHVMGHVIIIIIAFICDRVATVIAASAAGLIPVNIEAMEPPGNNNQACHERLFLEDNDPQAVLVKFG